MVSFVEDKFECLWIFSIMNKLLIITLSLCIYVYFQFGFSLDRTLSDAMNPYLDSHQEHCLLEEPGRPEQESPTSPPVVYFTMDLKLLK